MVLDRARELELEEYIPYGIKCLTASVLSIIITAPTGAILLSSLGPTWLEKSEEKGNLNRKSMYDNSVNSKDEENRN